ncbi:hypothetical protein PMKS-003521 [Pichia membranifaciens]|uniref:Uncharacterized protein n=1 Tax=Pichia membranifaciens TaxID=4926 RepID=A0A1Q2YKG8_9ASCO|nr:hypothetical protein PMKS-003521 [Pichia membranifaciens]
MHGTFGPAGSDTPAGSAAGPELASGHAAARSEAGCPPASATAAAAAAAGSDSAIALAGPLLEPASRGGGSSRGDFKEGERGDCEVGSVERVDEEDIGHIVQQGGAGELEAG